MYTPIFSAWVCAFLCVWLHTRVCSLRGFSLKTQTTDDTPAGSVLYLSKHPEIRRKLSRPIEWSQSVLGSPTEVNDVFLYLCWMKWHEKNAELVSRNHVALFEAMPLHCFHKVNTGLLPVDKQAVAATATVHLQGNSCNKRSKCRYHAVGFYHVLFILK